MTLKGECVVWVLLFYLNRLSPTKKLHLNMNPTLYSILIVFIAFTASVIEIRIGYHHRNDLIKVLCNNRNDDDLGLSIPQKDRNAWRIAGILLTFGTLLVCLLQNIYYILLESTLLISTAQPNVGIESDLFCTIVIQLLFLTFYAIKTLVYGVLISRVKMAQVKTKYVSNSVNGVIYLYFVLLLVYFIIHAVPVVAEVRGSWDDAWCTIGIFQEELRLPGNLFTIGVDIILSIVCLALLIAPFRKALKQEQLETTSSNSNANRSDDEQSGNIGIGMNSRLLDSSSSGSVNSVIA